ncbi:ABC transporter substrate-binding protein [Dictyoglomus thermophilum]|uniref:Oligopeptide ABC transporter, periplasmic oligopeptide-binding protein n=2 Tax=Dictyoglomus thermophilum TaxID=14 RepID=B5YAF9_DICT6|nr:ABC transporter substrate-binding protein [Dictyoglomus thermophilum]ACI18313.1 oligopeptide ABC transporter, periplasmic oligopeptide-binding protein [Dictyoglomus thermophilum H-6-12]TYT24383.1 ABC transporter substrate-binding protein [Dictyoglomus thermophilum]
MRKFVFVSLFLLIFLMLSQVGFSQLAPNVPRNETLIANILTGRIVAPDNFNSWTSSWITPDRGIQQLMLEPLWIVDPATGKVINALAASAPQYSNDFKTLTIKLRSGCYWSDGVEITADDLIYHIELAKSNPAMAYHASFQEVDKITKVDKYTVRITLKEPNARFHTYFLDRWGACRPLPKHIFEKVKDPASFTFNPPVSSGPYVVDSYDPGGYWILWKRRDDWQRTPTGKLFGMPQPKYVLFFYAGPTEKQVLAVNNNQLDMADLTMEGLRSVLQTNKYARAYMKDFPYIVNVDPCITGIYFNTAKEPYNNKEVRWALTLSIDIVDFLATAFDGAATMGALLVPPTPAYIKWYYEPLESWLKNFTITVDGQKFKVFDPDAPMRLAEYARKRGYKVPTDPKVIREIFGIGWFKYAPDIAEKLLIKNGFKRDKDGKWLLPDGKPWKMTILAHTNPSHPDFRNGFAAAQQWKKFGIDVEVVTTEQRPTLLQYGNFDACSDWPATEPWGGHPDMYRTFNAWRSEYVRPIGDRTFGHPSRWSNPRMDKVIEELAKTDWNSLKVRMLGMEGLKIAFEEMAGIPTCSYPGIACYNEYYWTNYPTQENPYCIPYHHWPNFKYMLPFLKPTGRK